MRTNQILVALTIHKEKSLSQAAKTLGLSQPTTSNILKALERELGFRIFARSNIGMILTKEGEEFIAYATTIEKSLIGISQIQKHEKLISINIASIMTDFSELAFENMCEKYCSADHILDLSYRTINDSEEAFKVVETGQSDISITTCLKNQFDVIAHSAKKRSLEYEYICDRPLEITCHREHPVIRDGRIRFDLLSQYPAFVSVQRSSSDLYAPSVLNTPGVAIKSVISLNPSDIRYRMLTKLNGCLISAPIPAPVKEEYDLESLRIDDSYLSIFALYQKSPLKEDLIKEYINICKVMS